MSFIPQIHHRESYRLKGYDYTQSGAYFITICTNDSIHFFGEIINGEMILNDVGKVTHEYLNEIPNHFSNVKVGEFVVMPNHVHCVIILDNAFGIDGAGTSHVMSVQIPEKKLNAFSKPIPGSVSVIIQQFKASVKRWCNKNNHEEFKWQSRFHDVIIRDEISYKRIANYILDNPKKWGEDKLKRK